MTSARTIRRWRLNVRIIIVPIFVLATYADVCMLRTTYTHIIHNFLYLSIFKSLTYSTAMYYSMQLLLKHLPNIISFVMLAMTEVVTWQNNAIVETNR